MQPQLATALAMDVSGGLLADQKDKLKARWLNNKALFMKQLLNFPLEPFQVQMLHQKGAMHLGRYISMRLLPRDSGKSWAGTIGDCVYEVCRDPNIKTQIIAEAQETAIMFLSGIKSTLANNDTLKFFFGDHRNADSGWSMKRIVSKLRTMVGEKEPTVEALGAGGATVGRHVNVQWLDDVVSERTSSTIEKQKKLETWYDKTAFPVLEQGGCQRINGTRWYPSDMYNFLLEKFGTDILFKVPALEAIVAGEYKDARNCDFSPVKWLDNQIVQFNTVYRSYFPGRYHPATLLELWRSNPVTFESQYQNNITLQASQFIRPEAIKVITQNEWPDFRKLQFFIGVDPASTTKERSDYFATCTIALNEDIPLIYVLRATKLKISDSAEMLEHILNEWMWVIRQGGDVLEVSVEDNAFQRVLVNTMYADPQRFGMVPVVGMPNLKDKTQRLLAIAHYFNLGKVVFDEDCAPLINELLQIPDGQHDDMADAMMNAFQAMNSTTFAGLSLPMNIHDIHTQAGIALRF